MGHTSNLNAFLNLHKDQLSSSGVPVHYWSSLYQKLVNQIFDAGTVFQILKVDSENREEYEPLWVLRALKDVDKSDGKHIYLIDHAWTFRPEEIKLQLLENSSLKNRMSILFDLDDNLSEDELIENIFNNIWKLANHYSVGNAENVEKQLPIWYIIDEVGSSVMHSNNPNCRIVPFFYMNDQITYSLLFPIEDIEEDEFLTRDFAEGITDSSRRSAILLPWVATSFEHISYIPDMPYPDYFLEGHIKESLPKISGKEISKRDVYKVYTQYDLVRQYLTDQRFILVDTELEADILWYTKHFKDFEELSIDFPGKYVNQFPFEYVITVKDLLCITCRRNQSSLRWLPTSYNLVTEIRNFVSYYQYRNKNGMGNYWIVKPYNLARGLDIHITNNLSYILKLSLTGPKIAQKYISNPVLFYRPECNGKVKFDIRYILLLKSIKPIDAYVYKKFFLRFANKPFEMRDFEEYEKHYTVMNYTENATLKHLKCEDFLLEWSKQYPDHEWKDIESKITEMLKDILVSASSAEPPCGFGENPQSRALYAADIMLEIDEKGDFNPRILEINFTPDCQRACEYYEDFYNDIFNLFFLDNNCNAFLSLNK
ncbi:unnamed protein product [Acanthoscelides obtectus]|uniref:Tubulin--tyrosine ligase-like protein 12 SET-like domain-containing protein n=2 Tax=Acanthoscelides obtectus TaxID=200917 RepID=A0A9P0K2N3_ACAOB|nr:unnamed protein product [Acanthoscelides obtectus]CAK1648038.1 Tubulin--tyrosine ligase-like protein 12 [Acanthoscelides obtectus]